MAKTVPATKAYDLLDLVFRHKWMALVIPTLVILGGIGVALLAPRSYRSEAKLHLMVGRSSLSYDPTAQTSGEKINLQQQGRDSEVATALELIRSRGVLSKVVEKLGAEYIRRGGPAGSGEPANAVVQFFDDTLGAAARDAIKTLKSIDPISETEEAIIQLEENLSVDAERDSTLLALTYSTDSAEGAQEVLKTLIEVYTNEHLRINRNEGSRAFFQAEEKLVRDQLDASMEKVRLAKNEIGVASIESRRSNLESQLQSVTMASYDAEAQRSAVTAELEEIARQLGGLPERLIGSKKSIPNEGADKLREQLYSLQVREADLKARYSDAHPMVIAISQQIEEAEKVVDEQSTVREETTDDVNPIHRDLSLAAKQKQSNLASLEARLRTLRQQDEVIRGDLEKLNEDAVKLARLEREQEVLQQRYYRRAQNLDETRIDKELEDQHVSNIKIAQEPTFAEKPVSPSKLLVALGSIVLAFAGTAASILGVEQVSDKLRTDKSIEQAVGAPILASIPDSKIHGRVLAP